MAVQPLVTFRHDPEDAVSNDTEKADDKQIGRQRKEPARLSGTSKVCQGDESHDDQTEWQNIRMEARKRRHQCSNPS
jgi:hypothetical protein